MTKAAVAESTAVTVFEVANPLVILTDGEKFDRFYDDMKRETDRLEIDLTTERGRKAIAAMAYKVARTKTAIDEAGKTLTAEWRQKISAVDESRRNIRDRLDALKEDVRRPLTDWEEAEKLRLERVDAALGSWRMWARVEFDDTPQTVAERLERVRAIVITSEEFVDHYDIARSTLAHTESTLDAAHGRLLKEAADHEELERLRAEAAERTAREEAERLEAERAARGAQEAKDAAEAAERAEARRKAQEEAVAEQAAKAATEKAEREAREAQVARDREHAEALAAEKRRADEADAARVAEAKRITAEKAAADAESAKLAREQEARDKDRKHRGEVMAAAKTAIMGFGVGQETAKKIVLAIVAGEIPNVTLRF